MASSCDRILVILALFAMVFECRAKTLAKASYIVADPAVRNFLFVTGLGYKVREQASILYDLSGFQQLPENIISGRREASTYSHAVVEVDRTIDKRSGRVKRDHPSHQERGYMERLFSALRNMERNTCIYRLLCDIGYAPESFGLIGQKVERYLRSVPAVTWNSASSPYLEAYSQGTKASPTTCSHLYGSCSYNLPKILSLLAPRFLAN